ncbi:T-cell surface glycoprotein CD3 zeta chain isoform X2 [Erpetoichthys calabaricus]|uniref:T-cell surface glycoprotein CD3 zeta chain isoform X2 n=1 Tax=Erpetoichthys calabaricus TaxID=27687 RepID=UPI002234A3D6|nr:T-cell surface glycoprotein CD3 zeta chain isoform X2 [Erpetoichthys calabaricus]
MARSSFVGFVLLVLARTCYCIPPHDEVARVARFIVHNSDWASMATIASRDPIIGTPFANVFSVSDGPLDNSTGELYMYLTTLEISVQDLQKMNLRRTYTLSSVVILFHITGTYAEVTGLTDPKLCYILDGVLLLYGIIITALLIKMKLSKTKEDPAKDGLYADLDRNRVEVYDEPGRPRNRDLEAGGGKKQRGKSGDTLYTSLKKDRPVDAYSEIGLQKQNQERRRGKGGTDQVYQGLSAATKDTYDALQMQPLPPR